MKRSKKTLWISLASILMIAALCVGLAGCGSSGESASSGTAPAEKSSDTAILVVSFGTSYNDTRDKTIGAIENAIGEAFPQYEVRRAFTSQTIIDKLKKRDNLEIDNVQQALDRAVADGIKKLVVQPTHLMNGYEYTDLQKELKKYEKQMDIALGAPLLTSDEDFNKLMTAVTDDTKSYDDGKTAMVFMGHGTEADSNGVYAKLQKLLKDNKFDNYFIGTVEATPTLEDVMKQMKQNGKYEKVVLQPLMVVAGDHANNDMAGDEDDSWKSILTKEGYEVECRLQGLGENEAVRQIYVDHARAALDSLAK